MKKRVVLFEGIAPWHRPWVAWYLSRGDKVLVFDFTYRLKSLGWLRTLIHEGRVERIYFHPASRAEGLALEATEWFYPRMSRHRLIRCLVKMVGVHEVESPFKHALMVALSRYFFMRLYLARTLATEPQTTEVLFVPESLWRWHRLLEEWCRGRLEPLTGVQVPLFLRFWSTGIRRCAKMGEPLVWYLASGTRLALVWLGRMLNRGRQEGPMRFTFLLAFDTQFMTKFSGGRRFDFLLDHRRLTKQNTCFLVGPLAQGPWMEQARKEGYTLLRRSDYSSFREILRCPPRKVSIRLGFKTVLQGILRLAAPEWLHQAASTGLLVLVRESGLLERIKFTHYVYANHYGLVPRWRNALIRKAGAQSWCFAYSNGGGFQYLKPAPFASGSDFSGLCRFWSYDNVDHFVSPCSQLIDYYKKHRQQIRWYHDVGNIWSEQIVEAQKTMDRDAVLRGWFGPLGPRRKVIAWFDTSFVEAPNSPSTYTEAIQWYSDILRCVDEHDDLLMVIKPSKTDTYYVDESGYWQWSVPHLGRRLMEVWGKLREHPRVRFLKDSDDPTIVIAVSDLTVTYFHTSVSAEALGARKRAIWYEPGQRWKDTLFGREPLLAAHGFDELKGLIHKLLFEMSEEQYQAYLDGTVRGLVESFLDGKGLSRFRALLAGEAPEEAPPTRDPQGVSLTTAGSRG